MLKLAESLRATTTYRAVVDSGKGIFVWDYTQDACPDTIVKLFVGPIKVLANSTMSFTEGTAIVSGRDQNQVAGLKVKDTVILCGPAAQKSHKECGSVLPPLVANNSGYRKI
jgi:hypothetical protein